MLTITLDKDETGLYISAAYPYGERIKKLQGAYWDREIKQWHISKSRLYDLMNNFKGELYFKTPLWEILGQPAPDVTADYSLDPSIVLPETKIPLYPYQQYGSKFLIDKLSRHSFAICADGVGLGKTSQAIAVMKWQALNRGVKRMLLIVKKSIKIQWMEEIGKFSDLERDYSILYTKDLKEKRLKTYAEAYSLDRSILIVSYHNFLNDTEYILKYRPEFVVIDEAHCVKARQGKLNNNISAAIENVPALFLTGTPVMSRPEDIFGIISMSNPTYFDPLSPKEDQWIRFKKKYLVTQFHFGYEQTIGARHLDELRDKCQEVVIRRTEKEVAVNMPETVEKNIEVEPDDTQLAMLDVFKDEEETLGDDYKSLEKKIDDESLEKRLRIENLMKGMIAIKQVISSDPLIMRSSSSKMVKPYIKLLPKNYQCSPKTEALLGEIEEILDAGEKAIIFTKYVTVGLYVAEMIRKKFKSNTLMYTGRESQEQRTANIKLFREDDNFPLLIGTDAMAEGLNLAEARHVINYDLPDTYAIYVQRMGRARRVSSRYKSIVVHNLITKGGADVSKFKNLQKNKELDSALIASDAAQSKALAQASNETTRK